MRRIILALLISAALGLGITAWAQDNSYPSGTSGNGTQSSMSAETASGMVVSSDSKNITIRTDSGQQMSFTMDPNSSGIPSNVQTGSRVDVTYTTSSDGTYSATNVLLSSSDTGSSAARSSSSASRSSGEMEGSSMSGTSRSSGASSASDSEHLPRTASPLPLIAITGLIALGGALAFRLSQRS